MLVCMRAVWHGSHSGVTPTGETARRCTPRPGPSRHPGRAVTRAGCSPARVLVGSGAGEEAAASRVHSVATLGAVAVAVLDLGAGDDLVVDFVGAVGEAEGAL